MNRDTSQMAHQQPPEIQEILDALDLMNDDLPTDAEATSLNIIESTPSSRPVALRNICSGAFNIGTSASFGVTLGAVFRQRSFSNEALTMLLGGVINGAIVGSIGSILPEKNEFKLMSYRTYLLIGFCEIALELGAQLTSPLMGELLLKRGIQWGETIIDAFVGISFLLGVSFTLMCCLRMMGISPILQHEEEQSLTPADVVIVERDIENMATLEENTEIFFEPRTFARLV